MKIPYLKVFFYKKTIGGYPLYHFLDLISIISTKERDELYEI